MEEMVSLHIKITPELNDFLESERKRRGNLSKASIIRLILQEEMDRRENNQTSA